MYQVLARKYRPKNFHELIGQNHVSTALINAIEQQRLHHAYLFTGTRGVGKTTIARILAKCLNCETGITSEPCGVCSTCVAIDAGRFIDLIEIDAASRTKVEDTRELLDNVPYAPTQGRYKVYLIDEVHMLSTHSFNALLKTLEEPPEHVKFLLATTDPQKLPITIISRCLQFVLRPSPQPQLAEYLAFILQKEQIHFTPDALWQIASSAKGSFRDALSLTDQAIAFGNGQIGQDTVKQMLGLIDQADIVGLLTAIVQHNTAQVGQAIAQLRQQVVDAKAVFDSLAETLHQIALLQILPNFDLQLDSEQTQARQTLAKLIPADLLQLYYEIVTQSREKIGLANTPLQALEMCILRLMAFRPLGKNEFTPPPVIENNQTRQPKNNEQNQPIESENSQNLTTELSTTETFNPPIQDNISLDSTPQPLQAENFENVETILPSQNSIMMPENTVNLTELPNTELMNNQAEILNLAHPIDLSEDNELIDTENQPIDLTENLPEISDVVDNFQETTIQPIIENTTETPIAVLPENHAQNLPDQPQTTQALVETSNLFQPITKNDINPLDLLEPAPQQLVGEWTPQKWDYWLFNAYQHKNIDKDEYAFAKKGVMVGEINGKSEFITNSHNHALHSIFNSLVKKLTAQFPKSHIQVVDYRPDTHGELLQTIPESLQQHRYSEAIDVATNQLNQLPVMQALLAQNAHLSQVQLLY